MMGAWAWVSCGGEKCCILDLIGSRYQQELLNDQYERARRVRGGSSVLL